MTQFGEGECLTFPIKILEHPPLTLKQEQKANANIDNNLDESSAIKMAIDDAAKKYYNTYIKNFEAGWLKHQVPYVVSAKEEIAEEKEI